MGSVGECEHRLENGDTGRGEMLAWLRGLLAAHAEKLRYLVVGAWNTLFGYLLFLALLALIGGPLRSLDSSPVSLLQTMGREYYVIVSWIAWVFAVPQSTATMKYLVFRKKGSLIRQTFRAYFIYLPAQALGSVILWLAVGVIGLTPPIGALAAIGITTVFSYVGHKYFTFETPLGVGEVPREEYYTK